ncbi:MAG: asparaginase [Methylibium sp. NZG]|nr:MAG: asparaginase [Methylibium sp. NZG]
MQSKPATVVILGTGGTIAGTATLPGDNVGYSAAQLGVAQLVAAVPALGAWPIEAEQVAQIDSKDMDFAVWRRLAERVAHHLSRPQVQGIVITHGTDTLEETAYFLQRVLAPVKPVVLAAAMRPATALQADGPQNLLDAVRVARHEGARGVVAVLASQVHSGLDVRKGHTYRLDAFNAGDAGPLAHVEEGCLRQHRPWPQSEAIGLARLPADAGRWPRVEVVTSHAGAGGAVVRALCADGVQGIVVAGTGNGSVHHALLAALLDAQAAGVTVWRSSRCGAGSVIESRGDALPGAGPLTPAQARIELMLQLCG